MRTGGSLALSLSGSEPTANSACTLGTHSFWEEAPTSAPLRPNNLQYTAPASLVSPRVPRAAASHGSASVLQTKGSIPTSGYLASLTANLWACFISRLAGTAVSQQVHSLLEITNCRFHIIHSITQRNYIIITTQF